MCIDREMITQFENTGRCDFPVNVPRSALVYEDIVELLTNEEVNTAIDSTSGNTIIRYLANLKKQKIEIPKLIEMKIREKPAKNLRK